MNVRCAYGLAIRCAMKTAEQDPGSGAHFCSESHSLASFTDSSPC